MAEFDDITAEDARTAAEITADVAIEQIADVYAEALLDAAENTGQTETVLAELDALVVDLLTQHPKLEAVFASAMISHEEKCGMIDRLLGGWASPLAVDFLKVVSRHGRLDLLHAIHRQARLRYDRLHGRVHVELTTATAVDPALAQELAAALEAALGAEPVVRHAVDPDLIGGAVLRIGDTVYDGSVMTQLEKLREQIMDRSAHEIQSRRDRFRDPAGD